MAEEQIVQTRADFNLRVPVSKLDDFHSPTVMIQDVPWNLHITKHVIGNDEWLAVNLICKKVEKSRDWEIAADATFRLNSSHGRNTIQAITDPYFFDYMGMGYGFPNFIKWTDLFDIGKKYVQNDTINFNIKVEMADQNIKNASKLQIDFKKYCEMNNQMTLQLTVNNIDKLMAVRTPELVLQNFHWDLTVFKSSINGLCIRLCAKNEFNQTPHNVKIDFKMPSSVGGVRNIEKSEKEQRRYRDCFNLYSIISWSELFKPENGFVINNSIAFEVKIKVDKVEEATSNANKRRASNSAKLEPLECSICLEKFKGQDVSSTVCGHLFCSKCIENAVQSRGLCPLCNTKLDLNKVHRVYLPCARKD